MTAEDGMHPNMLAQMFGYQDGMTLVEDLMNSRNKADREAYIKAEAETRMRQRHGDSMTDGSLAQLAEKAIHNGKQSDLLHKELEYVNAKIGRRTVKRTIYRESARQAIAAMPLKNIKPHVYERQERTARTAAIRAAEKGDLKESAIQQDRALRQHYLYREARQATDAAGKFYKFGRGLMRGNRLKTLQRAGDSYLEQVNSILGWLEIRQVTNAELDRRQSMTDWINAQMDQAGAGDPKHSGEGMTEAEKAAREESISDDEQRLSPKFGVTEEMMATTRRVNYRDLTPEQIAEVNDMLQSVYHLAQLKNHLLTQKDQRQLDEWVDALESAFEKNANNPKVKTIGSNVPKGERTKAKVKEMLDMSRTPSSLIRMLDGYEDGGDAWKLIGQPLQDAAAEETLMLDKANRDLEEIFSAYSKKELAQWDEYLPGQYPGGRRITKQGVISIFLNWGNKQNRQRVLDGFNVTEAEVMSLFDSHIEQKDVDFAEAMWAYLDTYRKPAFDLHRDMFGFTPDQVEPEPFMTKYGKVTGGYFPIQYDPIESVKAEQNQLRKDSEAVVQSLGARRNLGSNKQRMTKVNRAIKTDVTQVVFGHLTDVIHSTTHDRALYDVGRILSDSRIKAGIQDNFGDHIYKSLVNMVREIKEGADPVRSIMDRQVQWARNNATLAMLGFSIRTVILQPFGITNSLVRARLNGMGTRRLLTGYGKFSMSPVEYTDKIKEKSKYMQQREKVMSVAINRITQKIRRRGGLTKLTELSMVPIQKMQFYTVDAPLWLSTYDYQIEKGVAEDMAINLADQAVRDAQGGGSVVDTAESMRGGAWQRLFTNFLTYMMTTNSLYQQSKGEMKLGRITVVDHAINTMVALSLPAIMTALLGDFVAGDDDEQPLWDRAIREQLSFLLSMNPLSAQFSGAVSGFDYSGPQGTALISKVGQMVKQMQQGEADKTALKSVIEVIGLATGLPSTQFNRTVFGTWKGIEEGDSAGKIAKQAIFGPER